MLRKFIVIGFRTLATLLLLLSVLLIVAIRLSDKGDFIDRNSGWILLIFVVAAGIFAFSLSISDISPKYVHKKKTTDELMNEIKRTNLDKLRNRIK